VKILTVDDDPNSLRLLSVNLRYAGHEAVEALDGAAAWELYQAERPRMVVTDWMMPSATREAPQKPACLAGAE